jgi:hypothetical protein
MTARSPNSPLLFMMESLTASYSLVRRIAALRIIHSRVALQIIYRKLSFVVTGGESILLILFKVSYSLLRLQWGITIYSGESLFTAGNHYLQREVYFQNSEGFSLPIMTTWQKKTTTHLYYYPQGRY